MSRISLIPSFLKRKIIFFKSLKKKYLIFKFLFIKNRIYLKRDFKILIWVFYYSLNLRHLKFCCYISGRFRGVLYKFGLSRFIIIKKLFLLQLPGCYF